MNKKILLALSILALTGCDYVPVGHVGIKFNKYGGNKGVQEEVVSPGKYWLGWNEELYAYPTFTQNYVWQKSLDGDESISFQTKEGLVVNSDVGIAYHIDETKITHIFQKYRKGIDEITSLDLRNKVRDALVKISSTMPIESVYGEGKIELIRKIIDEVTRKTKDDGIVVENIYWIGEFRLPKSVVETINKKIEATQVTLQRTVEVETAKSEANKKREQAKGVADSILIQAQAQAKANKILAKSLNDDVIRYNAIKQWDGKLPQVTTDTTPIINIK